MMQLHRAEERFSVRVAAAAKRGTTNAPQEAARGETSERTHVAGAGVQVPLRSRTVVSPRMQLRTYYDSTEMRDALERLKQMCGPRSLDDGEEMMMMNHTLCHDVDPTRSRLGLMPGHVIVYCFSFCDMASLCKLACVNRRFSALSNAHHLWETHARLLNLPTHSPEHAREDIRRVAFEQRERWQAEVQRHEREYEELERRLQERSAAERALPLSTNVPLLSSPNGRSGFSGSGDNSGSGGGSIRGNLALATSNGREFSAQLRRLESLKDDIVQTVGELQSTLVQQKQQILELRRQVMGPEEAEDGEREGVDASPGVQDILTFADVQCFERRICRIVLSAVNDLPLVLRRGIDDFSTMELLCLHGGGDVGGRVRQRWAAFKRFFPPMSEDYGTVRMVLASEGAHPPSTRVRETVSRLGAVIRRVQQMTDNEILQIVM